MPNPAKYLGIFAVFLLSAACAPVPTQPTNENIFYKRDMLISVNGRSREGTLVSPQWANYQIDVTAKGDLDLFTLSSCHREITRENAGEGGIFGNKRKVSLAYVPVPGLEDTHSCVVRLGGYEKSAGRNSWALLDFEDPDTTLPAEVKCNGEHYQSSGVTICQSREGLLQQIQFPVPVVVAPDPACPLPIPADGKTFLFPMPPRECVYAFIEVAPPGKQRRHRLTTAGYSNILVRQ